MALLDEAIAIDPGYAPAYASRAKALMLLSDRPGSYGTIPALEALPRAEADVEKALDLDPDLADAYAVRGLINSDSGRVDFAIINLRRAIELSPNSLDARNWLALRLANDGRLRDVAAQLKALVDIDPLYKPGVNNAMQYLVQIGESDAARSIGERFIAATRDENEKVIVRAQLKELDGRVAEGIQLRETVPESAANSLDKAGLRWAYYDLGVIDGYTGKAQGLPVFRPWEKLFSGDPAGAAELARAGVEKAPEFYSAHAVYIGVAARLHLDRELVDYFGREYGGSLERFATRLRPGVNAEPPPYLDIAMALRSVGEQRLFEEAMQRMRFAIDIFRAGGDVSAERDEDEARYWAISGDKDKALAFLEQVFEKSAPIAIATLAARAYESLFGDPRFLALREKNLERINEERAILGYAPLTLAFYDRYAPPGE